MKGTITVATTEKSGNHPEDNMDACWPRRGGRLDSSVTRVAVADGATEHFLSRLWAARIVRELGTVPARVLRTPTLLNSVLDQAQEAWVPSLRGYVDRREQPIRWFEKAKLWEGAATTLLAVCFEDEESRGVGTWHAAALGDTNLFHVGADGRLLTAFPLTSSNAFNDTPDLLISETDDPRLMERIRYHHGFWRPGEAFYLATDALAAWILRRFEAGGEPWPELAEAVTDPGVFAQWVGGLRKNGTMRNDDVSLVMVQVSKEDLDRLS